MLSPVNMLLRVSLRFSLNFLSRATATASAALPLGHLMMGTTPGSHLMVSYNWVMCHTTVKCVLQLGSVPTIRM